MGGHYPGEGTRGGTTETIGVATDTNTPSSLHVAMLTKKFNSLRNIRTTIRSQGSKLAVTPREATATVETSTTCL
jgi:hypothetical protein